MTQIQITVQARNVYGREALYPVSQEAELLCRIAGTRTLSRAQLAHAVSMGCTVNVTPERVRQIGEE